MDKSTMVDAVRYEDGNAAGRRWEADLGGICYIFGIVVD